MNWLQVAGRKLSQGLDLPAGGQPKIVAGL